MSLTDHKGFRLLTTVTSPNSENNTFTPYLQNYIHQFNSDKCGLNKIVCIKITYNQNTETYRARIDSKKIHYDGSSLVLYETDYVEYRLESGVVMHLGTRLDPEVKTGTGLVGRIADVKEYADWACWVDEF